MRIAHISDIHFRGTQRHKEYKEIFEYFIEDIRSKNIDIIFIAGDIVHTKVSGISPELIEILVWWFKELASVAPVHVILGNHDGLTGNATRQDAITPIIGAIGSDRITLHKNSGVYDIFPGFSLCNFSIFDVDNWKNVAPKDDTVNIACYHGPVRGAMTDEGWQIDADMSVEDFKLYDICMLGDIHKQQFLDYKMLSIGISKPWIGYSSSVLQQGYGETVEGHGYLIWDVRSKEDFDVDFVQLPNYHPYVTLEWENDPYTEAKSFPQKSRFRIRSKTHISQREVRALTQYLLSRGALEVVFKIDQERAHSTLVNESKKFVDDIRNIDALLDYVRKYAIRAGQNFSADDWSAIEKIIRKNIESFDFDNEVSRHVKWSLKKAEWDNLFSYGESNSIDFSKLNGIVGIFGANRSGKSSLVGMLSYALFNTTDRGAVKNMAVINERKSYGLAKLDISTTIGDYYLERQTTKKENKKGEAFAPTYLNFFSKSSTESSDLSGEQRNNTEKVVRKLMGTFEDFAMTCLSRQGDLNNFINEGSTQRKAILSKFLDLDYLEKLYDSVKIEMNDIKYSSKGLYENYDAKIELARENLLNIASSLAEKECVLEQLHSKLEELKIEYSEISAGMRPVTKDDIVLQENILKRIELELKEKNIIAQNITVELKTLREKKEKIEQVNADNDVEALKKQYVDQMLLETDVQQRKAIYQRDLDDLKAKEKSAKKLLEVPCGNQFPLCKYIKDSHSDKATIEFQKEKVNASLALFDNVQSLLDGLKKIKVKDKIDKLDKLKDILSATYVSLVTKTSLLERTNAEIEQLLERKSNAISKLEDLKISADDSANQFCVKIKKDIAEVQAKISQQDKDVRLAYSDKGRLEHELQRFIESKDKSESILCLLKLYEFIVLSLSKKGIPAIILRSQLPIINSEVDKILQGASDFTVEFELDDELNSMDIYINYGDSKRLIELCSGMEKTIASIAIRVALINMTSLPKPDFFIIDEGFGTLDPNQVEACGRLLNSLKNYFRFVIMITHVDTLKDYVDNTIEITRKEKDSYVYYS